MNAGDAGFSIVSDPEMREMVCGLRREVTAAVTDLGGYAPPGSVVEKTLIGVSEDLSANHTI